MCNEPLPDSYIKKLCQSCIDYTLQQESSVRMKEIRLMIREELQSLGSSPAVNVGKRTRKAPSPEADTSAESGEVSSDVSQRSGSSDDEDYVCFPTDSVNNLVKSVRGTMGVSESKEPQTPQDAMFAGLSQKKGHVFPVNQAIKDLVKREWNKGQKGFVPVACKRRYPFDDEDLTTWSKVPKVDAAVASTSRRSSLPVEDAGSLSDPMDRKSDTILKKSWEACVTAFKPAIAATSTSRSMLVWLDQLDQNIKTGVSREKLRSAIPLIKGAAAFISDASIDSLRLAARTASLTNTARRALWLKNWKGDAQSRSKLCAIPCQEGRSGSHHSARREALKTGGIIIKNLNKKEICSINVPLSQRINSVDPVLPVGARLLQFAEQWKEITVNPWAINLVSSGLVLDFIQTPPDSFLLTSLKSKPQQEALETEIKSLISKHVLIKVPPSQIGKGFYSPLFLISKPDGSFRTIINLKKLNSFIKPRTFKMESIRSAIKNLFPNCYMVVLDLKDAYYHLPIHQLHQQFLRVAVVIDGQVCHLQYRAMPFGLSMAPRVFTKLLSEVMSFLRVRDTLVIPYLDDLLIVGRDSLQCEKRLGEVVFSLQKLGWIINWEKSRLQPVTCQKFLGLLLDSVDQICRLPDEKKTTIIHKVSIAISKRSMSLRKAMSLLGSLTSCLPAVQWAQFHTRQLQKFVLQEDIRREGKLDDTVVLTSDVIHSLAWWLDWDNLSKGVLWVITSSTNVTTDASPDGWGAHFQDQVAQGLWSYAELENSSNVKELKAIFYSLLHFLPQLRGSHTRVFSDNTTAVAYLNRQGGTRSENLLGVASDIMELAEGHLLSLSAVHIRGIDNLRADFLSRHTLHQGEWMLNREVFKLITAKWGVPQIDLFSTRANRQVRMFASLCREDNPDIFDALHITWAFDLAYAFPPWNLLPVVI
ncbi:uncharacterized protein LOC143806556 [Ranitomeya variabilis]|uniref:uncharacterized protein LOC143806556 n=1 Tax=Ranitomeya variabilis TaxID=490064 RepID=UPI0040562132